MDALFKSQEEFGRYVRLHFVRQDIGDVGVFSGMTVLRVMRAAVLRVMRFLRDDPACRFTQLTDACCVHYPDRQDCFELNYFLLSPLMKRRLRLVCATQEDVAVASVCPVFSNAAWYEREMWEMFGVAFENHPDMRRLLLPDDMSGRPLRKDARPSDRLVYDESKGGFIRRKRESGRGAVLFGVDLNRRDA